MGEWDGGRLNWVRAATRVSMGASTRVGKKDNEESERSKTHQWNSCIAVLEALRAVFCYSWLNKCNYWLLKHYHLVSFPVSSLRRTQCSVQCTQTIEYIEEVVENLTLHSRQYLVQWGSKEISQKLGCNLRKWNGDEKQGECAIFDEWPKYPNPLYNSPSPLTLPPTGRKWCETTASVTSKFIWGFQGEKGSYY